MIMKKDYNFIVDGVFIMDKASDLIPEHFRFVKGLVDSSRFIIKYFKRNVTT